MKSIPFRSLATLCLLTLPFTAQSGSIIILDQTETQTRQDNPTRNKTNRSKAREYSSDTRNAPTTVEIVEDSYLGRASGAKDALMHNAGKAQEYLQGGVAAPTNVDTTVIRANTGNRGADGDDEIDRNKAMMQLNSSKARGYMSGSGGKPCTTTVVVGGIGDSPSDGKNVTSVSSNVNTVGSGCK